MGQKKSAEQLEWDFYSIRKDASVHFQDISEVLIQNPDEQLAWLALSLGKFLVWHSGKIDEHSERVNSFLPIKVPTVYSVGLRIRQSAISTLEGKNIDHCNRAYAAGIAGVHERMDKFEKLLIAGGSR